MNKIIKRIVAMFMAVVMICTVSVVNVDAKGLEQNFSKKKVVEILNKYDPDGAYIVNYAIKKGKDISVWFKGEYMEDILDTLVHEECHGFTHSNANGFQSESIYIGNGKSINVDYTQIFESKIMAKTIPSNMRTFRYDDYVGEYSDSLASNVDGVYGLLNEFAAYCWGMNNTVKLFDYYKTLDVTPEVWFEYARVGASVHMAHGEFKYFILKYMDYAKKNYPKIYQEIMNNKNFLKAYTAIDTKFTSVNAQYSKNLNTAISLLKKKGYNAEISDGAFFIGYAGCGLYESEYQMLLKEIRKYSSIDTQMKKIANGKLSTPVISSLKATQSGVKITWKKVKGASKYRVFRKKDNGTWGSIGLTSNNYFVDKNVKSGKKYTYSVKCVSSNGKESESGFDKKGKSVLFYKTPTITKLTNGESGVEIKISKVGGIQKYRIFRRDLEKGTISLIATTTSNSYVDKKAVSGKKYTYIVRGYDSRSKKYVGSYDKKGKSITRYAQPKLQSVKIVDGGLKITWKKVEGASNYRVFKKNSKGSWSGIANTTSNYFVDNRVKDSNQYTYTVRCVTPKGDKSLSTFDSKGITGVYTE